MVSTEYHAANNLLRKQRPNESLQGYITYWMEICHCSMKMDPSIMNNKLVIVLYVKNVYNKGIHRKVAGAKNINTLLDAFKSAQVSLLKLKKYEGLVSDENNRHKVHTISQIANKGIDATNPDRASMQTDIWTKVIPSTNNHSRQFPSQHQQTQMYRNLYQQLQPHFAPLLYMWCNMVI